MTRDEIYVVIVLGLVGYWGTSALIRFIKKENSWTKNQTNQNSDSSSSSSSEEEYVPHCFEVLGVSPSASIDEIKIAYKKKISMYHPDKVNNMGPEFLEIAQRKSKEINAAYDQAMRLRG